MRAVSMVILSLALSCGAPKKSEPVISSTPNQETTTEELIEEVVEIEEARPIGAVEANFREGKPPFYALPQPIKAINNQTVITFEDSSAPSIKIEDTYGAVLHSLRFEEFNSDLLLVAAKLKDPIFIKYHLYVLKNNSWKPVVEPFTLHISHTQNNFIPIEVDVINRNKMFRHYSVFDLDSESDLGFTWRLLTETVDILNR